jgi:hypothetical protein
MTENVVFWDVILSGFRWNHGSVEYIASIIMVERISALRTTLAAASYLMSVTANVSSSLIIFTRMMEAIHSSETSVLTRTTLCHILKNEILHSHRLENQKSDIALTGWALYLRSNVFPVRYELGFYIPEDGILHNLGLI